MFTDPKMHENPPEKREKHLRMAEDGQNAKKKKNKRLVFSKIVQQECLKINKTKILSDDALVKPDWSDYSEWSELTWSG